MSNSVQTRYHQEKDSRNSPETDFSADSSPTVEEINLHSEKILPRRGRSVVRGSQEIHPLDAYALKGAVMVSREKGQGRVHGLKQAVNARPFSYHRPVWRYLVPVVLSLFLTPTLLRSEEKKTSRAEKSAQEISNETKSVDDKSNDEPQPGDWQLAPLADHLEDVHQELKTLDRRLQFDPSLAKLRSEQSEELSALRASTEKARQHLTESYRWYLVFDVRFRFAERVDQLSQAQQPISDLVKTATQAAQRSKNIVQELKEIREAERPIPLPQPLKKELLEVQNLGTRVANQAREILQNYSYEVAQFDRTVAGVQWLFNGSDASALDSSRNLWDSSSERGWQRWAVHPISEIIKKTRHALSKTNQSLWGFAKHYRWRLTLHLLLVIGLGAVLLHRHRRIRGTAAGAATQKSFAYAKEIASADDLTDFTALYPFASTLQVAVTLSIFLYPQMPSAIGILAVSSGIISALFLARHLSQNKTIGPALVLSSLLALLFCDIFSMGQPGLGRWLLLGQALMGIFCIGVLLRAGKPVSLSPSSRSFLRVFAGLLQLSYFAGIISLAASVDGIAGVAINGASRVLLVSICYYAGYRVLSDLMKMSLRGGLKERLLMLQTQEEKVEN
ncbi:MAG: hypothetical protein MK135_09135, partial [Polyangiaceae bacterium]|nr:hypothetical protein [Polyangiaceae bacterium]